MAADDKPILIDGDTGIIGRFLKFDKHVGDPNMVWITYSPMNTLMGSEKYKVPVKKQGIFDLHPEQTNLKGVPDKIMLIYQDKDDSLFRAMRDKNAKRIEELERQVDDLQLELAAARQRAESAQAGAKKLVSEAQEISKATRQRTSPFGAVGGFGRDDFDTEY